MNQGELYNKQYDENVYDDQGLPDMKIVDRKKVRNKVILSVGSGMGADLWYLTKTNKVYALDSSTKAVAVAIKHGVTARVADVSRRLPYPDNKFDIVVLKDILEHLVDPVDLLREAKRVLKRNGYIIISLPNHFWWWFRIRLLFGKNLLWKTMQHDHSIDMDEWNYMHLRFFTWGGVLRMLDHTGLKLAKGYWDLGTWAHYSDPEMFYGVLKNKKIKSPLAKLFLLVIYPLYQAINAIFPRRIRSKIVGLRPGLLCAGFYIRVKK